MRITLEPTQDQSGRSAAATHCKVIVEHPFDDLELIEVAELFRSVVLAWGFPALGVSDLIPER